MADSGFYPCFAHVTAAFIRRCRNSPQTLGVPIPQVFDPLATVDSKVQPLVGFCVRLALPGPARGGAGESAALAVPLHFDLPTLVFIQPNRRICPSAHKKHLLRGCLRLPCEGGIIDLAGRRNVVLCLLLYWPVRGSSPGGLFLPVWL